MTNGGDLVQEVLERNREQGQLFCSPDASAARKLYRAAHPTEIMWFKCMDGRLNGSVMTETPVGIIQPVRNIAGSFDLGWPYLGEIFHQWVEYAITNGRRCLPFVTYHFSKSDTHKGCKGHNFDLEKARLDAQRLLQSIEYAFGQEHTVVYPIMVGIETDEDTMLLHGHDGVINLADRLDSSQADLAMELHQLYPDMDDQVVLDLLALVEGNIRHIKKLRINPRPIEHTKHGEQILAIGRGFDWLHWLNRALIIGPFSYDLAKPIKIAAEIILANIREGLVPERDGALLMTSGVYRIPTGTQPRLAELKARSLEKFALEVIKKNVPELYPYIHVLSGTVDANTRIYTPLTIK